MSELNLDNIVGFKAVDKDGNEQNVTVDEMVDMVATRMVSALSETSSLSEISTLATAAATGNDVYENELPTVTDAANVRVLQSSGDAAQMTMQSLATKLGGLFTSLKLFPFMYKGIITNGEYLNELKSGYYRIQNVSENTPTNTYYGILISIVCGDYIGQISIPSSNNALYIRIKDGTFGWRKWMKFTGVQI